MYWEHSKVSGTLYSPTTSHFHKVLQIGIQIWISKSIITLSSTSECPLEAAAAEHSGMFREEETEKKILGNA